MEKQPAIFVKAGDCYRQSDDWSVDMVNLLRFLRKKNTVYEEICLTDPFTDRICQYNQQSLKYFEIGLQYLRKVLHALRYQQVDDLYGLIGSYQFTRSGLKEWIDFIGSVDQVIPLFYFHSPSDRSLEHVEKYQLQLNTDTVLFLGMSINDDGEVLSVNIYFDGDEPNRSPSAAYITTWLDESK